MTTAGQVVARARRMLRGSKRERFNVLAQPVSASDTTLQFTNAITGLQVGDYLGLCSEILYVVDRDEAARTVTVMRGVDDTTPVDHDQGDVVEINWRWLTADLLAFLSDEIASWPDGIFVPEQVTVSVGLSSREVDLPLTRYRFPLRARARRSGRSEWVDIPAGHYRVETGLPTSQYPSGNALVVKAGWGGSDILLDYAQAFGLPSVWRLDTDLDDVGLTAHLVDAAIYGIAWRALSADEANRSDRTDQPEPRIADEVGSADAMRAASAYKAIRDMRLEEEKRRLRQLYPLRVG